MKLTMCCPHAPPACVANRSLVRDIGCEVGSCAHLVALDRSQQGEYIKGENVIAADVFYDVPTIIQNMELNKNDFSEVALPEVRDSASNPSPSRDSASRENGGVKRQASDVERATDRCKGTAGGKGESHEGESRNL